MARQLNKISLLRFAGLSLALTGAMLIGSGCGGGSGSSNTPQAEEPTPPPSKPLPENCDDTEKMTLEFNWEANPQAFEYKVEFGFHSQVPFDTYTGSREMLGYSFEEARRGKNYQFTVSRQLRSGQTSYRYITVRIPLCADREAYQQANP